MKFAVTSLIAVASVFAATSASAQVSLENRVMEEVTVQSDTGSATTTVVPADSMAPGDTAVYTMTYTNNGSEPASNLVISNPISKDVIYVGPGSGSEAPLVSVDGGQTFAPLSELRIVEPNGATRSAGASDVTNVRWTIVGPVEPGMNGSVSYKGTVR